MATAGPSAPHSVDAEVRELKRRCVTDPAAIDALQRDWDTLLLASATGSPFCGYAWCVSWWNTFGKGWQPEVYTWENEGRVVALLPLMRRRRFGLREVSFLNGAQVAPERLDALVLPEARGELVSHLAALLGDLRRGCDLFRFRDLAPDGVLVHSLQDALTGDDGHPVIFPSPAQAGVAIDATFDAYLADRSQRLRRNFRHSAREVLKQLGAAPTSVRPDSQEHALACFDQLWRLHGRSFTRRQEFDYFHRSDIERFHREVLVRAGPLRLARFVTLSSGSRVFASVYCLEHLRRMYCYQIGFDPDVEKLSPGFLVIGSAIRLAFEEQCTYFDFLRGDEAYKQRWANATHHTVSFTQSMDTLRAGVWHAAVGIIGGLRKVKRALRTARP
jgi:CelD/BcsL family acetyltransferase involved in cellulose biosynthesis